MIFYLFKLLKTALDIHWFMVKSNSQTAADPETT